MSALFAIRQGGRGLSLGGSGGLLNLGAGALGLSSFVAFLNELVLLSGRHNTGALVRGLASLNVLLGLHLSDLDRKTTRVTAEGSLLALGWRRRIFGVLLGRLGLLGGNLGLGGSSVATLLSHGLGGGGSGILSRGTLLAGWGVDRCGRGLLSRGASLLALSLGGGSDGLCGSRGTLPAGGGLGRCGSGLLSRSASLLGPTLGRSSNALRGSGGALIHRARATHDMVRKVGVGDEGIVGLDSRSGPVG